MGPSTPRTFDLALEQIKSLNNTILIRSCEGLQKGCTSVQHKSAVTEPLPPPLLHWRLETLPLILDAACNWHWCGLQGALSWTSSGMSYFFLAGNAIRILVGAPRFIPRILTHFIFYYKHFTTTLSQKHWSCDLIHVRTSPLWFFRKPSFCKAYPALENISIMFKKPDF